MLAVYSRLLHYPDEPPIVKELIVFWLYDPSQLPIFTMCNFHIKCPREGYPAQDRKEEYVGLGCGWSWWILSEILQSG